MNSYNILIAIDEVSSGQLFFSQTSHEVHLHSTQLQHSTTLIPHGFLADDINIVISVVL